MKIGIVGNYGHDNNGDEAILQGIITQLAENLDVSKQDITIFSNNPENTLNRYGINSKRLLHKRGSLIKSILATIASNYRTIKCLDVLIIGGGGLLMDMYKRDAPLYAAHALMGKLSGSKVIIYGVGAGPISTKAGKFLIKRMIGLAHSVSVRDEDSKKLLSEIGINRPVEIVADPAFMLGNGIARDRSENIQSVGVTAVPYYSKEYWPEYNEEKYRSYINGMAKNLDTLIRNRRIKVTFFSTKYPQDVKATEDIVSLMEQKSSVSVLGDNLAPKEIVSICAQQDIIIGTRLHSLILASAVQTPVIGVGYHKKVHNFLKKIGQEKYYIEIGQLENTEVIDRLVADYGTDWQNEQVRMTSISEWQQSEAEKGIDQIRKAMC
ncbi:polysaccharide pyruvyl transferase family protein [Bacillus infantis]|uniref:polysaccharide pyruvyl transferase family protein n=1 Tax=Bacillus infantis TaxID=324767 RepID=UPI003CFA8DFD